MADADEDIIPRNGPSAEDTDLSDETQDFRFLAAISSDESKIPKRGEKDFEPHATALQTNTLTASRQAMHAALSFLRVHPPKTLSTATYHPETNMAYAYNPKGPLFKTMGQVLSAKADPLGDDERRGQRVWLLPEEVLYCIERGTVDVRWPVAEGEADGSNGDDDEGQGLPMSLQAAYAMFLGDEGSHGGALTFERYSVYTGLKRMGYIVVRAPSWNGPGPPPGEECFPPAPKRSWQLGLTRGWAVFFAQGGASGDDTLIRPGVYRSYAEIYRRLALINFYDPTVRRTSPDEILDDTFRITYHVWKPGSTTFKKKAPENPDFRIAVVNARETETPTLRQLSALLNSVPYNPPKDDGQIYAKLKQGYKSVILAVVDQGITSYIRLVDAAFGREKLYERKGRGPAGKRGGRGGGRGRGR